MQRVRLLTAAVLAGAVLQARAYDEMPFYDTLPAWTLEWTDAGRSKGTIATDAEHGGWKIHVQRDASRHGGYSLTIYSPDVNRSVIEGSGSLDLRGVISGPSHDNAETNAVYRIGRMDSDCLRANNGNGAETPAGKITDLFTPGTLTDDGLGAFFHNDGNPRVSVRDVYVVEPYVSKLPAWLFSGCMSLDYVLLKTPAATEISGPLCNCRSPQAPSSFSEWDFTSVKEAGTKNDAGCFGVWSSVTGTLKLPALQKITHWNAFKGCGMGDALLGLSGNLESVGTNAFNSCASLTNVVLGAQPAGKSLLIEGNAFSCGALKRVWFNGENPPTFKTAPDVYGFGTDATAEGAITFYVRDTPGWAEILAEADANGGLVAAARFNTKNRQRVERFGGFLYTGGGSAIQVFDTRFAEKFDERIVISSADFPYTADGIQAFPLTLEAHCSDTADEKGRKAHFHRWDGVPVALERLAACPLASAGEVAKVRPMFVHDWFYDTAAGTIENGIWKLNVGVVDQTARTLKLGTEHKQPTTMLTGVGNGILDLNGAVRDADGNLWTIVATTQYCMTKLRNWDNAKDSKATMAVDHPSVIVFPETLTTLVVNELNFNQSRAWPLEEVIFIAPSCTNSLNWTLNGANDLKRLLVRAPRVTTLWANVLWQGPGLGDTDLSAWDLSGVTTVQAGAFQCGKAMSGTLSLPSLVAVSNNNFRGYSKIEGAILATNLTLATVGTNVFNGCTALKRVVIGNAKSGCTIGEASFADGTKPESVTFLGRCNTAAADQVLAGTSATDGAKTATIYASSAFHWHEAAATPTEAEAAAMPAGALGVYRAGSRKAWLVDTPSPFDPKGLLLLMR